MGGSHAHRAGSGHAGGAPVHARRVRRGALVLLLPLAVVTLAGLVWLWPTGDLGLEPAAANEQVRAEVTDVVPQACPAGDPGAGAGPGTEPGTGAGTSTGADRCGTATVEITEGDDAGTSVEVPLTDSPGAPEVDEGDRVLLALFTGGEEDFYSIVDQQRGVELWVLAAVCAVAVVAFGRWRGLASLVGLGVSFALLLTFVVPAILAGEPPVLVAVVGAAAIALTVLYLTHGPSLTTTVAVLGTLLSLALTAALSAVAVGALGLTGVSDDLTTFIGAQYQLNASGLLLAGIVIGSLGVLDDVTVTQAATVEELARADSTAGVRDLYRAAAKVGRAHIASVVNTIVLAYAGSSLPLLIVVVAGGGALGEVLTGQVIAQEIVRSAVGTLGLVAAVPITTALAALAAHDRPVGRTEAPGA